MDPPKLGVHACARGKEACPYCRYGFPKERFCRGCVRPMVMEKGDKEGQWHAKFPRNDRLCCSYEEHVLLANMGNVDWRPVLNLWAVAEYVTKYASKAPKGSRRIQEVLKEAVDEVCNFVPEGEGSDFLRRSIQKFFARCLGERDYHLYEAVPLGLQLPQVVPLMKVVSLNTSGTRPLKSANDLKDAPDTAYVHHDSKIDKFDKRLEIVEKQRARGDLSIAVEEVRNVSMYEFWWKFRMERGKLLRSTKPVCLMVTPSFSADCANVEHALHEGYARAAVIAYWRHMPTAHRHELIRAQKEVRATPEPCFGETEFEEPPAVADTTDAARRVLTWRRRYLGVRDLWTKFEGLQRTLQAKEEDRFWCLMLMEMITDPMLRQWVPEWVVEQFERANPYYKDSLTRALVGWQECPRPLRNARLLRRVLKDMVKRHQRRRRRDAARKRQGGAAGADDADRDERSSEESGSEQPSVASDDVNELVERLVDPVVEEDPNEERVVMIHEPRPGHADVAGAAEGGRDQDQPSRENATKTESASSCDRPVLRSVHTSAVISENRPTISDS